MQPTLFRRSRRHPRVDAERWLIVGESPVIQSDNPARDIVGGRRVDFVIILSRHVLIGAGDVDECQHAAHRSRRIGIGAAELFPRRFDDLREAFNLSTSRRRHCTVYPNRTSQGSFTQLGPISVDWPFHHEKNDCCDAQRGQDSCKCEPLPIAGPITI